jgi:hypothetical protein
MAADRGLRYSAIAVAIWQTLLRFDQARLDQLQQLLD